jgi:hypothetical protein
LDSAPPFRGLEALSESAERCLTEAVYFEARSEPVEGQRAVAQVVLNRVRHPAFPRTICGVVYHGAERQTGCQFTFTCDGSLRQPRDPAAWQRASAVAEEALRGRVTPQVGFATHYHTDEVNPYWADSLRRLASVGDHIFYVWRGSAGQPAAFGNLASRKPHPPAVSWEPRGVIAQLASNAVQAPSAVRRTATLVTSVRSRTKDFAAVPAQGHSSGRESSSWQGNLQELKKLPIPDVAEFPIYDPTGGKPV